MYWLNQHITNNINIKAKTCDSSNEIEKKNKKNPVIAAITESPDLFHFYSLLTDNEKI